MSPVKNPSGHWPYALRLRGSVTPSILSKIVFIGLYAALVSSISLLTERSLGISPILISVLGFVVGLSLSFKTTTAYARWWEGRIAWQTIATQSRSLARLMMVHVPENTAKDCFIKKSAVDLLKIYPAAVMHQLRERRSEGARFVLRVPHLMTYASVAGTPVSPPSRPRTSAFKRAKQHRAEAVDYNKETALHGCLPVEIAMHLSAFGVWATCTQGCPNYVGQQIALCVAGLTDALGVCERLLRSPIPLAYNIVISQIVWVFMLALPFQLEDQLGWYTPALVMVTGLFCFGLEGIARELENPFGDDANDLPLEEYCEAIELELTVMTALDRTEFAAWALDERNLAFGKSGMEEKLEGMTIEEAHRQVLQLALQTCSKYLFRAGNDMAGVYDGIHEAA
ncbi:Bestrophin, RFP-TM, chloride channel-domain-containing protein [Protomyces lactucae-debilis]|uniref:Bestrophin, RFP-TM, chloride channel-domain-containing protein n=1 Tax=Protomyces lactucae-debilis TaxID=2754530 RepID=A0A1Y2FQX9_PROLT|nr:Bestrophin, RFP-TM, chloride channel-domain-containing protein [Protomyces lactucae-debilis]ORY86339.1 Bestrophin, RFP-TM, chloride channel-domain-containing protein [Protomyces lactucae-debilis]